MNNDGLTELVDILHASPHPKCVEALCCDTRISHRARVMLVAVTESHEKRVETAKSLAYIGVEGQRR